MSKSPRVIVTSVASIVLALTTACAFSAPANGVDGDIVKIRGLTIDLHLANAEQRATVMPSLEHQVDVAMSVDVPASVLEFFRTVTIVVDPAMLSLDTNGEYMQSNLPPYVGIKPVALPTDRPILLHELMHAYHHQVIKQPTPDVEGAYHRALQAKIYPDEYLRAAFLYDSREYFANMATLFLLGRIERPPYNCAIIKQAQPKFVAYISSVFGGRD